MRKVKSLYLAVIFAFLYAPILVLIAFSFNESRSRANWSGFTLKWYMSLFEDGAIMKALYNTLLIALLSSLIATVLGSAAAIGIDRMGKNGRRILLGLNSVPVMNPDIVMGVSFMILYISAFSFFKAGSLGFVTLLLSHIAFNVPYVVLSVLPRLRRLDKNLYEAALDLGATPAHGFAKVILPEILPGVITGAMLAFTLSIDDFVVSFFTTGAGVNTLSIIVYSMARRGINPKINALSTLMFLAVLALLYVINLRDTRDTARKAKEEVI